ncbi:MAG: 2-dehydropantoate 2-reductase [Acetobacteraceae bacterium]
MMRMLVVGAGATGGYFGARLAEAGKDVTFLVRRARAAKLGETGLQVVSPHGNITIRPKLVSAGEISEPFDLVVLAVKGFTLDAVVADFAPAVGPETMIVPLLNGMRHVDLLKARFGARAVLGGVCHIAAMLDSEGRVVQIAKFQDLLYGEMNGQASARAERLDHAMQGAGFEARLSRTIEQDMWDKWITLATLGGVTCLMRGTIGEIEAAPGGAAFAGAFLDEAVAIARAAGHPPSEEFITATRRMVTAKGSNAASSMYRNLTEGLPVEAEQIIGDLIGRGRVAAVQAPLLAAAFTHLSVYQARRQREREAGSGFVAARSNP